MELAYRLAQSGQYQNCQAIEWEFRAFGHPQSQNRPPNRGRPKQLNQPMYAARFWALRRRVGAFVAGQTRCPLSTLSLIVQLSSVRQPPTLSDWMCSLALTPVALPVWGSFFLAASNLTMQAAKLQPFPCVGAEISRSIAFRYWAFPAPNSHQINVP